MVDNKIFQKNLQALADIFPKMVQQIADYLEGYNPENGNANVDSSVNGESIIFVNENGRNWYLNSRYNVAESSRKWAEQYKDKNRLAVFVLYGLSDGSHIRELLKNTCETNFILVYEPNIDIFMKTLVNIDISDLIYSQRIVISVNNLNIEAAHEFVTAAIDYSKIRLVEYGSLPNYNSIYPEGWVELIRLVKNAVEVLVLDRNTQISFSHEFITNMLSSFDDLPEQYVINQLKEKFDTCDLSDIPAIIVSAGPSLDKNISELKKAEGKAFIIVADTAMKSVLNAGIIPDLIMTVDPHKQPYLFAHSQMIYLPMVVCPQSNKKLWVLHSGKRFYFVDDKSYISDLYMRYAHMEVSPLETGGSVANNCFSLAQYCGFKTIILIGQDLAYTNNKKHAVAAFNGADFDKVKSDEKYIEVEDIFGGKILTNKGMEAYLKWFEKQILRYPELKVIDATEGGAKIHGSEIISLKEVIERECVKSLDIKGMIESISPIFDDSAKKAIYKEYAELPEALSEFKKKINLGIRDYDKLYELFRKNKTGSKEYEKCLKGIEQINYDVEHVPFMELAAIYNRKTEYEIQGTMNDEREDQMDEIRCIVEAGKKLLNSYKDAIDQLIEDLEEKRRISMRELYESLSRVRFYMSRVVYHYRMDDFLNGNLGFRNFINSLTEVIDLVRLHENSGNKLFEIDFDIFNSMLQDILYAQENKDYLYVADLMEEKYISYINGLTMSLIEQGLVPFEEYERENLEALRERYPELLNELSSIEFIDENKYQMIITYSGGIAVRINSQITYEGTIDPYVESLQKFENSLEQGIQEYTIVGLNFCWVQAIQHLDPEKEIYIFEHDINLFKIFFKFRKLCNVISAKNIHLIYDKDFSKLSGHLKNLKGKLLIHQPCITNIENQDLRKTLELAFTSINSILSQKKLLEKNFLDNLLLGTRIIDEIKNNLRGKDIIYIAGGPSLDNDIEVLQAVAKENRYLIMAAGTVAKKLLKNNIIPHYILLSDPKSSIIEQIRDIDERIMKRVCLLYLSTVSSSVIEYWKGEKYMLLQMDFDKAETYAANIGAELFESGGSVSTLAVDMAIRMECNSLICVGLDLAYTNDKIHASNCKELEEDEMGKLNDVLSVSSVDGSIIKTAKVYEIYRKFIESRIARPDVKMNIYNTAKGAYIKGMKHENLEDLICRK
ncbi:MAG: motility associated factor glycosyltransferase family protein [Lachnospiraceae bacterium]|nr:motility associated factor glycosyltransferase family protein [Lachnospiraceae bacterium]